MEDDDGKWVKIKSEYKAYNLIVDKQLKIYPQGINSHKRRRRLELEPSYKAWLAKSKETSNRTISQDANSNLKNSSKNDLKTGVVDLAKLPDSPNQKTAQVLFNNSDDTHSKFPLEMFNYKNGPTAGVDLTKLLGLKVLNR